MAFLTEDVIVNLCTADVHTLVIVETRRRQEKLRIIVFQSNVRHFVLIERVFVLIVKTSLRIGSPFGYSKMLALEF